MGTPYYAHAGRYIGGRDLDPSSTEDPWSLDPRTPGPQTPGDPRSGVPPDPGPLQVMRSLDQILDLMKTQTLGTNR